MTEHEFASPWLEFSTETLRNRGLKSTKTGFATFETALSASSSENVSAQELTLNAVAVATMDTEDTRQVLDGSAAVVAGWWFDRIGAGWPQGLSMDDPVVAPLLALLGEEVAAALNANNPAAIEQAFQSFRRTFGPVWRGWKQQHDGGAA